jgi:hypothetical protein
MAAQKSIRLELSALAVVPMHTFLNAHAVGLDSRGKRND